jgi:hypothetical protein
MIGKMHTGSSMRLKVPSPALLQSIFRKAHLSPANFLHSTVKQCMPALCALTIAMAVISGPVAAETNLSADAIVERAVERAERQNLSMVEANYKSEAVTKSQSLDENDSITDTETTRYRQYPLNGAVFEELVEIDGRPLNEKEIKKEEEKKRDFIREVEIRRTRGDYIQPTEEERIRFNRDFTERYLYTIEKTEEIRGHPCWTISFKPREGKLPVRNRMDRALNQMTGTLWIARDDFGLVRVEFALRKPFKYWGGFLAVIRKTDGWVDYTRVDSNVWLPMHFNLQLDLKVMLLKNIRRLITKEWFHYSRVEQPSDTNQIAAEGKPSPSTGGENP